MVKIDEQIEKYQNDSIDLDLQARLAQIKTNMRGLDSSTDKYNNLVKEVLALQIKRLENEKKKLKAANIEDKVKGQSKVSSLEKEINDQLISFTKYKLDTKANAGLKNKSNINLRDLEKVFHEFIVDVSSSISGTSKASINLSEKSLFRSAINSKRNKQEAYNIGTTGASEQDSRKDIAGAEVDYMLDSEKDLAKSLKEAFIDIKETVESTSSKREFDIQSEKFKLLVEVLEKNKNVINDDLEKELEKLIGSVRGEVQAKNNLISRAGGKYDDIKADAERLGITQKISSAGGVLADKLGYLDSELGTFVEGVMSTIEGLDRFATTLFKLPETLGNFKKFISGSFSILSGKSGPDNQVEKLQEVKESIDSLGEKFTNVVKEKTEVQDILGETPEQFTTLGKGLKGVNKLSKAQSENLSKGNRLTKLSNSLMTGLNLQMTGLLKTFGMLRIKSFFTGIISVVTVFAASLVTATIAAFGFAKTLFAKTFLRGMRLFTTGIIGLSAALISLSKFTLPIILAGLTSIATVMSTILVPLAGLAIGVGLAAGAVFVLYKSAQKFADWVSSYIPDNQTLSHNVVFDDKFHSGLGRIKGWMDYINPFGPSESEKQAQAMANDVTAKSKPQPGQSYGGIGGMARKSESGSAGSSAIGWDRTGGWSYGQYQVKQDNMPSFMQSLDENSRKELESAGPIGSPGFNAKWKEMAKSGLLGDAEQKYIEDTHYKPTLTKTTSGEELSKRGDGLKELLFSISVNEGESLGSSTINSALKDKDVSKMSDEEIIEAISAYRKSNLKNRYQSSTAKVQASISRRIEEERTAALSYDNNRMKIEMARNEELNYKAKQQLALAQAAPPASIINQSTNIENGSSSHPNTPVDLRNQCSTMVRSMDRDYCLQ